MRYTHISQPCCTDSVTLTNDKSCYYAVKGRASGTLNKVYAYLSSLLSGSRLEYFVQRSLCRASTASPLSFLVQYSLITTNHSDLNSMGDNLQTSLLNENQENSHDFPQDRPPITCSRQLLSDFWIESRKLWNLAGPVIFTSICQYSLGAITQTVAGHLSPLDLAAVSVENTVIAGLALGIMWGLGSALETLCGQAFGAGQLHMLGTYMQRSWVILISMASVMTLIYIFATPILRLLGQSEEIAQLAGVFSMWMLPQLFAYALNFPIQKFLQAQSKVIVMAWVSGIALIFHIFLSWLCIIKLGWGLVGAATSLNLSWWIVVLGQLGYVLVSDTCKDSWTGFSWEAFHNLAAFARLSLASAVMLCLEFYYYMMLVILAGRLKNPEIAVDAISICMNLDGWEIMIPFGFNAAISVRVSNELGAGRPRAAKFSVVVVTITSLVISLLFMIAILTAKDVFAVPFTNSKEVIEVVSKLATLLAFTLLLNGIQPVLSGVAIGAWWQGLVAYVNIGCYYIVGVPLGFFLGSKLDLGVQGIWSGMISGTGLQTAVLCWIVYRTNWNKEAAEALQRIRHWGGGGSPEINNERESLNFNEANNNENAVLESNLQV